MKIAKKCKKPNLGFEIVFSILNKYHMTVKIVIEVVSFYHHC